MVKVAGSNGTIDFSDALLFSHASIANGTASCTLRSDGPPVAFSVSTPEDAPLTLVVRFNGVYQGAVECTVDQSQSTRPAL